MSLFSCAEPNANELEQRILLIYIRFGTWEERRLTRASAAFQKMLNYNIQLIQN